MNKNTRNYSRSTVIFRTIRIHCAYMNLASFVDVSGSYEPFYTLLEYLLAFYNGTAKKDTSILIVSGGTHSGKSTMLRIIRDVAMWGYAYRNNIADNIVLKTYEIDKGLYRKLCGYGVGTISGDWLSAYPSSRPLDADVISAISGIVVTCYSFVVIGCYDGVFADYDNTVPLTVAKLHEAIGNNELCCRTIQGDVRAIKDPAVIVVATKFETSYTLPCAKRSVKGLHLPHRFDCYTTSIADDSVNELCIIAETLEHWDLFKKLCIIRSTNHDFVDLSSYIFRLALSNHSLFNHPSGISQDWWRVILQWRCFR